MEEGDVLRTPQGKGEGPECEEWELVDDDGFLFKRRKRKEVEVLLSPATLVSSQEPVLSEDAQLRVREALTRKKKMAMLLAQKEMYATELADWEMQFKRLEESQTCAPVLQSPPSAEPGSLHNTDEATSNEDLQILHLQVEAHERFTKQLQRLLAQGESMCEMLEVDVETNTAPIQREMLEASPHNRHNYSTDTFISSSAMLQLLRDSGLWVDTSGKPLRETLADEFSQLEEKLLREGSGM